MKLHITSLALGLFAFATGCQDGVTSATGKLQVTAAAEAQDPSIDLPILQPGDVAHLDLSVKRIEVHIASDLDEDDDHIGLGVEGDADDDGAWITVAENREISLHPGANRIDMGIAVVPAGKLTQVRLVLADDASLWTGLATIEVACPSCKTSGLKLMVEDDVEIPSDGQVLMSLMFDLDETAIQAEAGGKLGPVMQVDASVLTR